MAGPSASFGYTTEFWDLFGLCTYSCFEQFVLVTLKVELPVSGWHMAPSLALGSDFPLAAWTSSFTLAGRLLGNLTASPWVHASLPP